MQLILLLQAEEKRKGGFDADMEERMRQFNLTNRGRMAAIIDDISSVRFRYECRFHVGVSVRRDTFI